MSEIKPPPEEPNNEDRQRLEKLLETILTKPDGYVEYTGIPRIELAVNQQKYRSDSYFSLSYPDMAKAQEGIDYIRQQANAGKKAHGDRIKFIRVKEWRNDSYTFDIDIVYV